MIRSITRDLELTSALSTTTLEQLEAVEDRRAERARLRKMSLIDRLQFLVAFIDSLDFHGDLLLAGRGPLDPLTHSLVPLEEVSARALLYAWADVLVGDLLADLKASPSLSDRSPESSGSTDGGTMRQAICRLAELSRRQSVHRWNLLVLLLTDEDLPKVDRSGLADRVLETLDLPRDDEHREALTIVHTRQPRGWWTQRWRRAMYHDRRHPVLGLRRWLRRAVTGVVRDERRRGRRQRERADDAALLALHAQLKPIMTPRQIDVLYGLALHEISSETGGRLGISPEAVRRARQNARVALARAGKDPDAIVDRLRASRA